MPEPWHVCQDPGNSGAGTKRPIFQVRAQTPMTQKSRQSVAAASAGGPPSPSKAGARRLPLKTLSRGYSTRRRSATDIAEQRYADARRVACAGLPLASQDNQLRKQGSRMLSKASIRMSMAGSGRPRGTRDQGGYQEEHKVSRMRRLLQLKSLLTRHCTVTRRGEHFQGHDA